MYTEKIPRSFERFPFRSRVSGIVSEPMSFTDYHLHTEIEIIQPLQGKMQFKIYEDTVTCEIGDILIINSNIPHASRSIEKNTQQRLFQSDISLMYINPLENTLHQHLYSFLNTNTKPYYFLPHSTKLNRELGGYLKNIHNEITNKDDMSETYIKGYLNLLSACLNRNKILVENFETKDNRKLNKILPIVNYIDQNYNLPISLDNISEATHLNEYYLCRIFKAATGQTVFNYINYIRICEAENLLTNTSLSITDIAFSVGFSNISRFDEAFKRITGTTPLKYRKHAYTIKL